MGLYIRYTHDNTHHHAYSWGGWCILNVASRTGIDNGVELQGIVQLLSSSWPGT
jgi:hypothetical protein